MEIVNGIIESTEDDHFDVVQFPTRKVGGTLKPLYIVMHGWWGEAVDLVRDADESTKYSTHLFVHDDEVIQYAPLTTKTWHAGASYWQGWHGLNSFAIGVHARMEEFSPTGEPLASAGTLSTLHAIIPEIVMEYNIRDIMSHEQVTKLPGMKFTHLSSFKPYVEYGNADSVGRFLAVATIAVRSGPDVLFEPLDTINAGEAVKVLRYSADAEWAFVLYERDDHKMRQGWVHESFLRRL